MPPLSRGLRPIMQHNFTLQPARHFHSQPCLRQSNRNARGGSYRRTTYQEQSFAERIKSIPKLFSRLFAPFRSITNVFMRIPARWRRFIGDTLKFLPIVWVGMLHFPFQTMHANGGSMTPFLNPNNRPDLPETKDRLLIRKLRSPGFNIGLDGTPLQRGEIVVFWTPHDPTKVAVKRIVGLPGDKITPRRGFKGGDEVVVQYNHIWVEGDVEDFNLSRDSNWYGQISQNLVIGRVIAIMQPWYSPHFLNVAEHDYPAKREKRVMENAVEQAAQDLDKQDMRRGWTDGSAQELLDQLRLKRSAVVGHLMMNEDSRKRAARYYMDAVEEVGRKDPNTRQIASSTAAIFAGFFEETGFEPVVDEEGRPDLCPTDQAARKMQEWKARAQRKQQEPDIDPATLLKLQKVAVDQAFERAEADLDKFDDWWFFSKMRPKAVLAASLSRRKKKYDEDFAQREKAAEQEREKERWEKSHMPNSR